MAQGQDLGPKARSTAEGAVGNDIMVARAVCEIEYITSDIININPINIHNPSYLSCRVGPRPVEGFEDRPAVP